MSDVSSPTGLSTTSGVVPITPVGALSEAWYEALGYAKPKAAAPKPQRSTFDQGRPQPKAPSQDAAFDDRSNRMLVRPQFGNPRSSGRTTVSRAYEAKNDAARGTRIRKTKQAPPTDLFTRSAGRVTVTASRGRVRMLIQRHANQLHITAVCDPKIAGEVADALATARMRLSARGISVKISTHVED